MRQHTTILLAAIFLLVSVGVGCSDDESSNSGESASNGDTSGADAGGNTGAGSDSGVADEDVGTNDTGADPDIGEEPMGDNKVGVTFLETPVAGASGRTLATAVWYPAAPDSEGDPYVYLGFIPNDALRDAPVAAGGPWPVIVFSHGNGGVKEQSVFLTEALAQAGYIVVAVDHTGNTFFGSDNSLDPIMNHMRPLDMIALLDRLEAPEADDPVWLAEKMDLERIGILGHSRGGYTALATAGGDLGTFPGYQGYCADNGDDPLCTTYPPDGGPYDLSDDRIDVVVAMSPARYSVPNEGLASIDVPVMVITGKKDTLTTFGLFVKPLYDALETDKLLWTLENAGHYTFTDLCKVYDLLPPAQQAIFGNDCDEGGPLLLEDAHALTIEAATAWFDEKLKQIPAGEVLAPRQEDEVGVERPE